MPRQVLGNHQLNEVSILSLRLLQREPGPHLLKVRLLLPFWGLEAVHSLEGTPLELKLLSLPTHLSL